MSVSGLVRIKEANDIEEKLNEVERLLKNAINMPCKVRVRHSADELLASGDPSAHVAPPQFSRSEVMLTFFERSPLDQVLRNDKVHRIQPCFQSPMTISGKNV